MSRKTIFEKIIDGDLPSVKVFENERLLAIKDICPKAPVHLLIMPKKKYTNLQSVPKEELAILAELALVAQDLARQLEIEDNYRFLTNNGKGAGQTVEYLHFHLIGGKELGPIA